MSLPVVFCLLTFKTVRRLFSGETRVEKQFMMVDGRFGDMCAAVFGVCVFVWGVVV